MRSKTQALEIVADTWTTIKEDAQAPMPEIVFEDDDKLDTPAAGFDEEPKTKEIVLGAIHYPLRLWRDVSEGILRAETGIEMANYHFRNQMTILEKARLDKLSSVYQEYASQPGRLVKELNLVHLKYERDLHIIDVQLVRKLEGDEGVFIWFQKAGYDSQWIIDFFDLLISETPKRIFPYGRRRPRINGLMQRIRHIRFLEAGCEQAAQKLLREQSEVADRVLAAFKTPVKA